MTPRCRLLVGIVRCVSSWPATSRISLHAPAVAPRPEAGRSSEPHSAGCPAEPDPDRRARVRAGARTASAHRRPGARRRRPVSAADRAHRHSVPALAGRPPDARVITPKSHGEQASELGLGQLVEVYTPLRIAGSGPPEGAFEIYLHYQPIAAAIARDKRTIAVLVGSGLALLWAVLFPIVARASRRQRLSSQENYRLAHYDPLTGLPNRT